MLKNALALVLAIALATGAYYVVTGALPYMH